MNADETMSVHDEIDWLLVFMGASIERKGSHVPIRDLGAPIPILPGTACDSLIPAGEDSFIRPEEFGPNDMPLNLSLLSLSPAQSGDPESFGINRYRRVSPKAVRGRVHGFAKHIVEFSAGKVTPSTGLYESSRAYLGWQGRRWRLMPRTDGVGPQNPDSSPDAARSIQMAQSVQFSSDWWWLAKIGWIGHPMVTLPTDAVGAREVFRLRDIPAGKKRRTAIRHWVSEHWRQRRKGPGETRVREHLRGGCEFTWNGFYVKLMPSIVDQERAAAAKGRT